MYTYNKDDKSYTFSSDDIELEKIIDIGEEDNENNPYKGNPKNIEVINGGNDLDISPVSDYIEIEKPKNEKKDNIVIPENNKD